MLKTEWGEIRGYIPSNEEMKKWAKEAGFSEIEFEPWTTPTGRERQFVILRKGTKGRKS